MPVQGATLPLPTARYISGDIVTAIRGKAGESKLDVAKLLALVEELNDNYRAEEHLRYPCAPAGISWTTIPPSSAALAFKR